MKVAIDITRLYSDALTRGVGYYAVNLVKALQELKDGNKYYLQDKVSKNSPSDVIHFPYFDPFFLTLPLINKRPTVITVHDLTQVKFPQHYPRGVRGEIKWQIQQRLLRQADAIIADSLSSKKDIQGIINYPESKIYPIYLAADTQYKKLAISDWQLEIKKHYHLPETFLLYVGDINWNKNVKGLIEAFCKVKCHPPAGGSNVTPTLKLRRAGKTTTSTYAKAMADRQNLKLILIGNAFENNELPELQELKTLIKKYKLEGEVNLLGFVPLEDLVAIYNLAMLYIQPSFYEGFGLPVLEAMTCGCPVISSNQGSLPEIGGKAVEYFNPYIPGELANKISSLLTNNTKLTKLKVLGLSQAKKFFWKQTALATIRVYEKIS